MISSHQSTNFLITPRITWLLQVQIGVVFLVHYTHEKEICSSLCDFLFDFLSRAQYVQVMITKHLLWTALLSADRFSFLTYIYYYERKTWKLKQHISPQYCTGYLNIIQLFKSIFCRLKYIYMYSILVYWNNSHQHSKCTSFTCFCWEFLFYPL